MVPYDSISTISCFGDHDPFKVTTNGILVCKFPNSTKHTNWGDVFLFTKDHLYRYFTTHLFITFTTSVTVYINGPSLHTAPIIVVCRSHSPHWPHYCRLLAPLSTLPPLLSSAGPTLHTAPIIVVCWPHSPHCPHYCHVIDPLFSLSSWACNPMALAKCCCSQITLLVFQCCGIVPECPVLEQVHLSSQPCKLGSNGARSCWHPH